MFGAQLKKCRVEIKTLKFRLSKLWYSQFNPTLVGYHAIEKPQAKANLYLCIFLIYYTTRYIKLAISYVARLQYMLFQIKNCIAKLYSK